MMFARARALVLVAATVAAGTLVAAAPSQADEVPPEWGEPTFQAGLMSVIGRVDGHMAHRRGNQHVFAALTRDEEVLIGEILDWRCPAGVTAPLGYSEPTTCVNKGFFSLDFDYAAYAAGAELKIAWGPQLRYMTLRSPGVLTEAFTGTVIQRGTVSIRARATGALTMDVYEADYESYLTRTDARVVGGKFMGIPWLSMTSVEVAGNSLSVYNYYDLPFQ